MFVPIEALLDADCWGAFNAVQTKHRILQHRMRPNRKRTRLPRFLDGTIDWIYNVGTFGCLDVWGERRAG
jgi:hypothetical protein